MSKLIVIMIDGISAHKFEEMRTYLPHLDALAKRGCQVKALTPEICGTSFPGRTSIICGTPPSEHGIYGNKIWDGDCFRWSNPYDVRVPTLATYAKQAGLDVANVGYGMVRPEDCHVYVSPWWVQDVMSRGRDQEAHPANALWTMEGKALDPDQRLQGLGIDTDSLVNPIADRSQTLQLGILADYQLLELAACLIESEQAPDLLLMEVGITDYYFHAYGMDHPLSELSIRAADSQVGMLIERLEQAGKLDDYNFAIMSDHGHAAMMDAVYCDRILPENCQWSSEGSLLLVAPENEAMAEEVTQAMLAQGMEVFDKSFIPTDLHNDLLVFACPEGEYLSFEADLKQTGKVRGVSKYKSNHGMRPNTPEDYRFCIFAGKDVEQQVIEFGEAIQLAPTLAKLLKIDTDWSAPTLF